MKSIFLSYRQKDTQEAVALVFSFLEKHYPREYLFRDCEHLLPGMRLSDSIRERVTKASVVVAIIGPEWCGQNNAGFRIDDPNDWVRQEIELAVSNQIPIIPLLVRGASMPDRAILPDSLAPLTDCLYAQLRADHHLESDLARLLDALKSQGVDPENVHPTQVNLCITVEACHLVHVFHNEEQKIGYTWDYRQNLTFEESEQSLALPCVRVMLDNQGVELRIVAAELILGAGRSLRKPFMRELPFSVFSKGAAFLWQPTGLKLLEKDKLTLTFAPAVDGLNYWVKDLLEFGLESVRLTDAQQRLYFAESESVERTNAYLNHCFFNCDVDRKVERIRRENHDTLESMNQLDSTSAVRSDTRQDRANSSASGWTLRTWMKNLWKSAQ